MKETELGNTIDRKKEPDVEKKKSAFANYEISPNTQQLLTKNFEDEIIAGATLTHNGERRGGNN